MSRELIIIPEHTKVIIKCDWCGAENGTERSDESRRWSTVAEKKPCGHDICQDCWYYPAYHKCPICGPRERGCVGYRTEMNDYDWCLKHGCLRDSQGFCTGCETEKREELEAKKAAALSQRRRTRTEGYSIKPID